jgi:hypothetical protein
VAGTPQPGALGTYTWGDAGTDAPWIVPTDSTVVRAGESLTVDLEPALAPATWTARWAPVAGGSAGDVASAAEGTGAPSFAAPDTAGPWSLQLEAHFGQGHSAAWYWRVEVR